MKKYDVLVIGAATSGSFFAQRMASKGYSVIMIDKLSEEKVGTKYDIFHIQKKDFGIFDIPRPYKGDPEWAFEFKDGYTISPFGNYKKHTIENVVGLHMHEYTLLMNRWAERFGVQVEYNCSFKSFILENGRIVGVIASTPYGDKEISARVVVDCSGAQAPARLSLPDGYGIDKFSLGEDDKFYVTLKYINFENEKDYISSSTGCPFYKTWVAPCGDHTGAILGVGSCHSYEYGEEILKDYLTFVPLGKHKVTKIERGITPYSRSPYSFVADGYIVSGDAACLTKPMNGEGVTSSMVHMEIACDVLGDALGDNEYVTKEKLWKINTLYNKKQGADFAATRAMMINLVRAKKSDFEKAFSFFSESLLQDPGNIPGFKVSAADLLKTACGALLSIAEKKISREALECLARGIKYSTVIKLHYLDFPETPDGFEEWCADADELWRKIGKMQ